MRLPGREDHLLRAQNVSCASPNRVAFTDFFTAVSKRQTPTTDIPTDDDSSEDEYGAKRTKTKRRRRRLLQESAVPPGEVRFSTRKAARVTNYNEDDDDEFEEPVPQPGEDGYVYQEEEPDVGGIDVILDHRPREGVG